VCALIGPFMANLTTLGVLFWYGYEFTALLAIVPFLVFAIGRSFQDIVHECPLQVLTTHTCCWQECGTHPVRRLFDTECTN
jgi:hypothetical protein